MKSRYAVERSWLCQIIRADDNPVMADIRPDRNRPMVSDRHRTGRDLGSVGPVDPALGTGRRRLVGSDDRVRRPDTSGGTFARSSVIGVADIEIILAGRARAGDTGEKAVEQFGAAAAAAAAYAGAEENRDQSIRRPWRLIPIQLPRR